MADERKNVFIDTVEKLFEMVKYNEGKTIDFSIPEEAIDFFEDYKKGNSVAKEMTDKGYNILLGLKEVNDWITAKALGEKLDISGRSVSGTMRKLVTDGFAEKLAGSPASYKITEKGLNYERRVIEEN